MRFLFVMDPIDRILIDQDSTFAVMLEAQHRGHEVLYCLIHHLSLDSGVPHAEARPVSLRPVQGNHADVGEPTQTALRNCDAVFMRKDPPFNMDYIFATYILEAAEPHALVVNRAASLRNHNEKLYSLQFPEFCPPSLVAANAAAIVSFQDKLREPIVVKPLDGNGGVGVFIVTPDDANRNVILEVSTHHNSRQVIAQRYVPEATEGDKRILLIDGKFEGAVLRTPGTTDPRGNIHVGATCHKTELTEREIAMVAALGPRMQTDGHLFVGFDVIGDYLTEINVTSPTGINEINTLDGRKVEAKLVDAVERAIRG